MNKAFLLLFLVYPTLAMFASFVAIQMADEPGKAVFIVGCVFLAVSAITAALIIKRETDCERLAESETDDAGLLIRPNVKIDEL